MNMITECPVRVEYMKYQTHSQIFHIIHYTRVLPTRYRAMFTPILLPLPRVEWVVV
jgi:hypothetical protein